MANEITTTSLTKLFNEMITEISFTANENYILKSLVKNVPAPLSTTTTQVPVYPTDTIATAVAEGTDYATNTDIVPTDLDLTVSEHVLMSTLTDLSASVGNSNNVMDIIRYLGSGVAKRQDQDITGLFTSFSTDKGPGAGIELTPSHIFQAVAALRGNNVTGEIVAVLHPAQVYAVQNALTNSFIPQSNAATAEAVMRNGFVGELAGVNVFQSTSVQVDINGDAIGAVFASDAIALADRGVSTEIERNASLRASEIVTTGTWAEGILHNTYGVKLTSDSIV